MMKDDIVKIGDFGSCSIELHNKNIYYNDNDILGTEYFLPPESLEKGKNYNRKSGDIWALGVTFFIIVFGIMPFEIKFENNNI